MPTHFEVAIFHFRGKAPDLYLAQANGLGASKPDDM